jgi:hypothetical protein
MANGRNKRRAPGWARPFSLAIAGILAPGLLSAAAAPARQLLSGLPLCFIANRGQVDARVAYYARRGGATIYFAREGLTISLPYGDQPEAPAPEHSGDPRPPTAPSPTGRWVVKVEFVGANPLVRLRAGAQTPTKYNFFRGSRASWVTSVPSFQEVTYEELWPGIDLSYAAEGGRLKATFTVKPRADPRQIHWRYSGATQVAVEEDGGLDVAAPAGGMREARPVAYQDGSGDRQAVTAAFTVAGGTGREPWSCRFSLGPYDPTRTLVIDPPSLVYCGYIGGDGSDIARSVAVDSSGCAYIAGQTASTESTFPETGGPDTTHNGGTNDAFVAKVSADGASLAYCGFIGGDGQDYAYGVAVDGSGCAYVAGYTASTESTFPDTGGPDLTHNGGTNDAFVAKVSSDGSSLAYCGFIGGDGDDQGCGIAVDTSGNAYVTGNTTSTESTFPETGGPDLSYNAGTSDAFVAKVSSDGSSLAYCGFIGGNNTDVGNGIAIDGSGSAYVVGTTRSTESTFSETGGPDLTQNGLTDCFVAKVQSDGTSLTYCGYIGGSNQDYGRAVAVDSSGCAYVAGYTPSLVATFPETVGPDLTTNGGNDAFVAKVSSDGSSLTYCGFIGGTNQDYAYGIAVDSLGCAYVSGHAVSTESAFPETGGPDLTHNGGSTDAFLAKVSSDGTSLAYCGYIGGDGAEYGYGIAVDSSGNAYVAGQTASTESTFPDSGGPDLTHNGGTEDAFVAKISNADTQAIFAASTSSTSANASSASWKHTVGAGDNRALVVGVALRNASSETVSSITYGGTSLTQVTSGSAANGTNVRVELWYLLAPAVGTDSSIEVTLSGSTAFAAGGVTLTGVNQTTPFDSFTSATGSSTAPSVSVSSAAGDVVIDIMGCVDTPTVTIGASQTLQWTAASPGTPSTDQATGAQSVEGGAASVTMSHTLSSSQAWAIGAVSINPASATAVELVSFEAAQGADGVLLTWETGKEMDTLGFHLWREDGRARERITRSLVPGSTLRWSGRLSPATGSSYRYFDPGDHGRARYWLEEVELSGAGTRYGPIAAAREARQDAAVTTRAAPVSGSSRPRRQSLAEAASARARKAATAGAQAAIKIAVRETGWYRLAQPELIAAGLDPGVDPRRLTLRSDGVEVRMRVTGESDGRFDARDSVEFYGTGIDTPSTDARIYWLRAGEGPHRRIAGAGARRPWARHVASYLATVEHARRSSYFASLRNGQASNFFGEAIQAGAGVTIELATPHVDPRAPRDAALAVELQGVTLVEHRVRVAFNGLDLGAVMFMGRDHAAATFAVPHAALVAAGANELVLAAEGGELDVSFVNRIRLSYWRLPWAEADALSLAVRGGRAVTIRGFSEPAITVLDVTQPAAARVLRGRVFRDGDGYAIAVSVSGVRPRALYAFAAGAAKRPAAVELREPSPWRETVGADMVMIAGAGLLESLSPLIALRERQGRRVAAIAVDDLYDAFAAGRKDPGAIKEYLALARPRHVLLVGDASLDPRDYLGTGVGDIVPTGIVETMFLETASDDWFVDFDGDGIPEIPIGRLPARTAAEAAAMVAKIVAYEEGGSGAWARRALAIADRDDGFGFAAMAEAFGELFPGDGEASVLSLEDATSPRDELLAEIDAGCVVVAYCGHGSVDRWSSGGLVTSADARALGNGERLPFVMAMTCLNGYFHDVYSESLAESLLGAEEGGAVAVWASSGLTRPEGQQPLGEAALRALFDGSGATIGEALLRAKATASGEDGPTWILFGDPAMRLRR